MEARHDQVVRRLPVLVVALLVLLLLPGATAKPPALSHRNFSIAPDLRDGDVVFRRGASAVSRIVLASTDDSEFSHVGVILRNGDAVEVVHSLPSDSDGDGVRVESLESFSSGPSVEEVAFYRASQLSEAQRAMMRAFLIDSLGRPFDRRFKLLDDSAYYCTELVIRAFSAAGVQFGTLDRVWTVTLTEPAVPPDALHRSSLLSKL